MVVVIGGSKGLVGVVMGLRGFSWAMNVVGGLEMKEVVIVG